MSDLHPRLQAEIDRDMARARDFAQFLDWLTVETPAVRALREAAEKLRNVEQSHD